MKANDMADASSSEREQLRTYYEKLQGRATELEDELSRLLNNMEEVAALTYARRALEVIVTEICQNELKRNRGSEPMEGILDRFAKERIIPEYIIISMRNLNRLGILGAHPKPFSSQQVREAFIALTTTVDWYIVEYRKLSAAPRDEPRQKSEPPPHSDPMPSSSRYKYILGGIPLVVLVIAAGLYFLLHHRHHKVVVGPNAGSKHLKIAASNPSRVLPGAQPQTPKSMPAPPQIPSPAPMTPAQIPSPAPAVAAPANSTGVYRYGMVCLKNLTGVPIHYFFRWGDSGQWEARDIEAGGSHWHAWKYDPGSTVSPDLHVKFDVTLNGGDMKDFVLARYAATARQCGLGKTYDFVPDGDKVGLKAEQ